MTTIAIDKAGSVAWDSQITYGSRKAMVLEPKVIVRDGYTFCMCGMLHACMAFVNWYCATIDKPPSPQIDAEYTVVVIEPNGNALQYTEQSKGYGTMVMLPHALGSGSDFALGAMAMGASALRAVEIAGKFDVYTSGPYFTHKLEKNNERAGYKGPWGLDAELSPGWSAAE